MSSIRYADHQQYRKSDTIEASYQSISGRPQSSIYDPGEAATVTSDANGSLELQVGGQMEYVADAIGSRLLNTHTDFLEIDFSDSTADLKITGGNFQDKIFGGSTGMDTIHGGDGPDRVSIAATPALVDGGTGRNSLEIRAGSSVTLTDDNFANFGRVIVDDGTTLDASDLSTGLRVVSHTDASSTATITGSTGDDHFGAGKGIETFNEMMVGFGRDAVFKANLADDTFNVPGLGPDASHLHFLSVNEGTDTLIYGDGGRHGDTLVLKDLHPADVQANAHFTFNTRTS